jgi:hypothetical protein
MISHEFGCDVATARRSSPAFAAQREGLEKVPLTGCHSRLLGARARGAGLQENMLFYWQFA